jgi:hypothetical protein
LSLSLCRLQDEELDIPGLAKTGGKLRFSRTAWGLEIWEMLVMSISLLYEPELQVLVCNRPYELSTAALPVSRFSLSYTSRSKKSPTRHH